MSLLKRIGEPGAGVGVPPTPAAGVRPSAPPAARPATPMREPDQARVAEIRRKVQERLIETIDPRSDTNNPNLIQRQVDELLSSVLDSEAVVMSRSERARLLEMILHDITGLGPLEDLLADPEISEIMVNGPKQIYVERKGKLQKTTTTFLNDEHAMRIIDRIIAPLGRRVDESSPMVDARLKDGSRVNVIIRPISLIGPVITIRKFAKERITVDDLIRFGTVTREMVDLLAACIKARLNIVVAGGTGSGKTTTLNILSSFIPEDERIITIENAAELQLRQEHVVTLESRPASIEGTGEVTMMDLIVNALRMRPDRIIVGECRGGETLAMLQAMNTGHDGSLTTLHANSPRDAIARIETMCLMAGMDLPIRAIREQTASAVDLIVQQARLKDGSRKIVNITEVLGMEGEMVQLQDIFVFEQTGVDENGKIVGRLRPTGVRPRFLEKFEASGIYLPPGIFGSGDRFI
ncbi:CpaF family protein [Kallotenue papyrolyticum]|uniref:CpaF family protein n=1 Tax=Kallotenue papyrolyticum TaxID=1325125 RepID=UPI0004785497|nr:CpaF family protein [Kallotenue papyrolyticum]